MRGISGVGEELQVDNSQVRYTTPTRQPWSTRLHPKLGLWESRRSPQPTFRGWVCHLGHCSWDSTDNWTVSVRDPHEGSRRTHLAIPLHCLLWHPLPCEVLYKLIPNHCVHALKLGFSRCFVWHRYLDECFTSKRGLKLGGIEEVSEEDGRREEDEGKSHFQHGAILNKRKSYVPCFPIAREARKSGD